MLLLAIGCLLIGFLLGMLLARPMDHEAEALYELERGDPEAALAKYLRLHEPDEPV